MDSESLGVEVRRLRPVGPLGADDDAFPVLAALVGPGLKHTFGERLSVMLAEALAGLEEHPHHLTALQLFGLDESTQLMSPRDARRVACVRVRGTATPKALDAFRKSDEMTACRLMTEALVRRVMENGAPRASRASRSSKVSEAATAEPPESDEVVALAVLAMDIVTFSLEFDQTQRRMATVLLDLVAELVGDDGDVSILPTGDGAIVVFERSPADRAAALAVQVRRQLANRLLSIPLRMGIHVGQGMRVVGPSGQINWAGSALNTAQRVMDLGGDRHILLSRAAAEQLTSHEDHSRAIVALSCNPVAIKHGIQLDVFNYFSGTVGRQDEPLLSEAGDELIHMGIGRKASWQTMFRTAGLVRALDLSMPMLGSPALIDHLEERIVKDGGEVRILIAHPVSSMILMRRRSTAYKTVDELETTIEYVAKILRGLRASLEPYGSNALARFDVRLFYSMPSYCGVLINENAYVSLYTEHLTGSRGPYFEFREGPRAATNSIVATLRESFDRLWDESDSLFAATLTESHVALRDEIAEFLGGHLPHYMKGDELND